MYKPPPSIISPSHVVFYAYIDDSIKYTGNSNIYIDGELLGAVPCLAICYDSQKNEYLLTHCNDAWEIQGLVSGYASSQHAKDAAENMYHGISSKLIETHYKEEDADKYLDETYLEFKCSFCGKRPDQVTNIVRGKTANICNLCIASFHSTLPGKK